MQSIAKILFAKMASVLEIKREEMEDLFEDVWQSIKINYYPPCPQPDRFDSTFRRCRSHNTITGESSGRTPDQERRQVGCCKTYWKCFSCQYWGNLRGKRLIIPIVMKMFLLLHSSDVSVFAKIITNWRKRGYPVAMFHSPGKETVIGPAKSLVEKQKQSLF